jgi:hypothetical protein
VSLHEVVHAFLADCRCEGARAALGPLYGSPDLANPEHNHLRAAALVACKPALEWLGLQLVRHGDEGHVFASRYRFSEGRLDEAMLREHYNVFGVHVWSAASAFLRGEHCGDASTQTMLQRTWPSRVERAFAEASPTIWIRDEADPPGILRCVEGNRRLHSLVVGLLQGRPAPKLDDWKIWIRR